MTDKQQAALKQLAKKLSAIRATLAKEERAWLDQLVLGGDLTPAANDADAEVTGHQLSETIKRNKRKTSSENPLAFDATSGGYVLKNRQ